MSQITVNDEPVITANQIFSDVQRIAALPRYFGRHCVAVENAVYTWMRRLSPDYDGGYWNFYAFSNGGFYMSPDFGFPTLRIRWPYNCFEGEMSADAAGIVACLFALGNLQCASFPEQYDQLRDFAARHAERKLILAAID